MLKTVSSITNAIGALNYKGTWNASTNTPTITSGVGVKGDYYVVSVAGSTAIDGLSNWGVGDWITFNGSVWQRVEGGADVDAVNVNFTGVASGPTYETSNAAAGLTIADNNITADGTDANIDINITPKGSGRVITERPVQASNFNEIRLFAFSRDNPATDQGIFRISSLSGLAGSVFRGSFAKISFFAGRRGSPGSDRQFAEFFVRIYGISTYTADITRTAGDSTVNCTVDSGASNSIDLLVSFNRPAGMYLHMTIESQAGSISFVSGF
jgi:hypothetical protein